MKSIRRTIMLWALPGLACLWIGGGIAVVVTTRAAMLAEIDRDNIALSREVRMLSRGRGAGMGYESTKTSNELPQNPQVYYQVWNREGVVTLKSPSLGALDLPLLEVANHSPVTVTTKIDDTIEVRLSLMRFAAGPNANHRQVAAGGQSAVIAVGRNLTEFRSRLMRVSAIVVATGLAGIGLTALLLAIALRRGLHPLKALGAKAAGIDAGSLNARFSSDQPVPKELEPIVDRLDSLMERLEAGFAHERRFSADLAHELRSPLAELRLKTDLAIRWPEERTEAMFGQIGEVVGRLERVVETLLQLARVENGRNRFESEPIALAPLIEDSWQKLGGIVSQRGLTSTFTWPSGQTIEGDASLWRHIIDNLLTNAALYAQAAGEVRVECMQDGLRISNPVENVDPTSVVNLFERFWRAEGARSDTRHCGLGLSLVRACAEAMGYSATAEMDRDASGRDWLHISIRHDAKPEVEATK
ncbi:ATP-binding protein [Coraliomargarita parva]|uniref:ATP-binding protein n=1 Tax=Coraliomargarita parva TaxID=3014050 RepID=UPI0022B40B26|nr:ATP-binding protein [Coraliomargarita parva]